MQLTSWWVEYDSHFSFHWVWFIKYNRTCQSQSVLHELAYGWNKHGQNSKMHYAINIVICLRAVGYFAGNTSPLCRVSYWRLFYLEWRGEAVFGMEIEWIATIAVITAVTPAAVWFQSRLDTKIHTLGCWTIVVVILYALFCGDLDIELLMTHNDIRLANCLKRVFIHYLLPGCMSLQHVIWWNNEIFLNASASLLCRGEAVDVIILYAVTVVVVTIAMS